MLMTKTIESTGLPLIFLKTFFWENKSNIVIFNLLVFKCVVCFKNMFYEYNVRINIVLFR